MWKPYSVHHQLLVYEAHLYKLMQSNSTAVQ